jgi:hypothetical protein
MPAGIQASLTPVPADGDEPAQWQLSLASANSGDAVKDLDDEKQDLSALQEHLRDVVVEFDAE